MVLSRCAATALLALLALGGCAQSGSSGPSSPGATATRMTSPRPASAKVTKILVFVVENHSLDQMRSGMPETVRLAEQYGYATDFHAITHPSLPNYLAIAGGSTFEVTNDGPPSSHPISGASVFGQAIGLGKTAKVYVDGMPGACALEDGGDRYAVRHNPWTYFVDERELCTQYDVSTDELPADIASGNLPNAGMVVPNRCHDAHDTDCDLSDADTWLRDEVGAVLAGPDFGSGHLAVVVTADEDDHSQDNTILTAVLHPSQRHDVVTTHLTHFSLARLYDQVLAAPLLRHAADAPDMARAFGLPIPASSARRLAATAQAG